MRIFRRGRSRGPEELPGDGEPDADFPFLTVGQAARLRARTRAAFAEAGVESTIHGDHLTASDGWTFGLHNLFAGCHAEAGGERAWPKVVRAHVAKAVRLRSEPSPADLPADKLLAHAFIRVCGAGTLPSLDRMGYHRRLGGDLLELLAYDTPDAVAYLSDDEVGRVGVHDLRAAGVENLLTEPFGQVHWLSTPERARFAVLLGDSVYTASRLLVLDDVLRRALGEVDTPNGVVVSVPNRHQLAFHLPADAQVLSAVEGMVRFTLEGYQDAPGGVSPHVFWRPPGGGTLEQLTRLSEGDAVSVRVHGAFAEVVQRLVGLGPDAGGFDDADDEPDGGPGDTGDMGESGA
jgi:hypothetical protein